LFAFTYGGIYLSESIQLQRGNSWDAVKNDARPLLIQEIQTHLKFGENNCCLFEEPILYPSDSKITAIGIDYVYLGSEQVFYFFNTDNFTGEKIEKAIKVSDDYIFLCALSSLDSNIQTNFFAITGDNSRTIDVICLKYMFFLWELMTVKATSCGSGNNCGLDGGSIR
jgi:hypothetical protein